MSRRTTIIGLGLALALSAGVVALLSTARSDSPNPASNAVATAPGPSGRRLADDPATSPPTTGAPPRGRPTASSDPFRLACEPKTLLAVSRRLLDDPAAKFTVERIEVIACRNGHARVLATPRSVDPPVEGDQLFLRYADETWHLLARGAGIDCGDAGLKPDTAAACRALA